MSVVKARERIPPSLVHGANDELALLAKALGHPARVGILRLLLQKQACIGCDIVDEIGLAQSTTSEHLRILKAAGIITGEIERPRVCYSLNRAALEPLRRFLDEVAGTQPGIKMN
jgi:DNA-binding transcriptional ArsR family regulator